MKIVLVRHADFPAPPERVCDRFADISSMTTFPGWGPIPGIERASWASGAGERGSVRVVKNKDGTKHKEEVTQLERPHRMEDRIYDLESPLRFMVKDVRDSFDFAAHGSGTRLTRTFTFELSSPLWWPAAQLVRIAMNRAVDGHHAAILAGMKG